MRAANRARPAWKPSEPADQALQAAEPAELLNRLRRVGKPVHLHRFQTTGRAVGPAVPEEARRLGADLLVTGAHNHSRLSGFIPGSTTRETLDGAPLPVPLRH